MIPFGPRDSKYVGMYHCSNCGWWGAAQDQRPTWSTFDCPRCGVSGCQPIPDPVPTPIAINTAGDCPSGLQPEERSPELFALGIQGELLYILADLQDRVSALEAS